jgi:CheY-like chemotaxis protein
LAETSTPRWRPFAESLYIATAITRAEGPTAEDAMKPIDLLVVDNNISDIFLIRVASDMEPYPINIQLATNSNRADQMLAGNGYQPDLVIFDLSFAKPSNLSLLESIDPHVPVVVFTSSPTPTNRRVAMDLGVVEYVEKPTHPTEFIESVLGIVRQWTTVPES